MFIKHLVHLFISYTKTGLLLFIAGPKVTRAWSMSAIIQLLKSYTIDVIVCFALFSNHHTGVVAAFVRTHKVSS